MEGEAEMTQSAMALPKPAALLEAWKPFRAMIGVTSVRTPADYARASDVMASLLDEVGEDENHPLADLLDYLSEQVLIYEKLHVDIPDARPHEVLRFLMDQHGLKQINLKGDAPQSRISDILSGKRVISKAQAKAFARRFDVSADLFL
jgi:HTH-type transcriptional regulator / antitoxin HigA